MSGPTKIVGEGGSPLYTARHLIGGSFEAGPALVEVRSPADRDDVVGWVPSGTQETVGAAVDAAESALPGWRGTSWLTRGNVLYEAAHALEARVDELGRLAAREMGKPLGEAVGEARRAVAILRFYGGEGFRAVGEVIPAAHAGTLQYTKCEPLGVVGIITPWNFPLAIPMWKVAPALVFGNTVVIKPAELASLTAHRMFELIAPCLPDGVLNVVHGAGRVVGDALIRHPKVRGISFTGSTEVGRHIAAVATERGVKYQLEMGGKNPVIVADDADVALAVERTVSGAMRSSGQKCTATSRVIILQGVRQAFTEALMTKLRTLRVGHPLDPETYLGPVVSGAQQEKVLGLIERGSVEGAKLLLGGQVPEGLRPGHYVTPTLFGDVDPKATLAQEEIFGPVVALLTANSIEDAIDLANDVRYGLSASVFTRNLSTALRVVDGIEAGMVRVNEETAGVELQAPFGGMKESSSHSREQGRAAMAFYTHTKTVAIRAE